MADDSQDQDTIVTPDAAASALTVVPPPDDTPFLEKATKALGSYPDGEEPLVPFQTQLKLTKSQEKLMIDYAFQRLADMGNESGRDQTLQPTWWANLAPAPNQISAAQGFLQASTFLGKRSRFDATFYNDVSWRPWTMGVDNIFMSSNIAVPIVRRVCRQMIARAIQAFFGGSDWFSVDPTPGTGNTVDEARAVRIENFCRYKLAESDSKDDKEAAISIAMILGECAVKTSYVVRDQIFDTEAVVLHDIDGQPIRDTKGDTITQDDDQWVDAQDGAGTLVLAKDGVTRKPDALIWNNVPLNRRQVLFEGARSEPIYYKDFLCPLTAKNVQVADCVCHLYDKVVAEFVDLVVKRGMVDDTTAERKAVAQKMLALVQKLESNTAAPKSAENQAIRPNENYTPVPSNADSSGPVAEFAEFYMWFDANNDGIAENIMLICDRVSQAPIYYDHVANVTTDGLRPIEIIRINPVQGRWYGQGIMELFESYQTIIDLLVNRWNFSQSRSGRVDFWTPTNTLEGDRDPSLKMGWGGTYTKKAGVKAEDILEVVYLNDIKFDQIQKMIQFFIQLLMNESGVSTANDDQAAGMQSSKLATGIMEVQKSGDELFRPIVSDLESGMTRLLNREVDVTLANINPEEAFTYLKGDTQGIDKITPDDVRGLKMRCTISLTTHKNQQTLQQCAQAAALVEKFYLLPPDVQARVAPFYRDQLRALSPKSNPDDVIVPMPPKNEAPPPEPTKSTVAVTAKIEQLNPQERQEIMGKVGVPETVDQAALSPPPPQKHDSGKKSPGGERLGDPGTAGSTQFATKLSQTNQPKTEATVP